MSAESMFLSKQPNKLIGSKLELSSVYNKTKDLSLLRCEPDIKLLCLEKQGLEDLELLCMERQGLSRAFEDPVLLNDGRVLDNLLQTEDRYLPNIKYFAFQPEVKPSMRQTLASWMLEVI